MNKTDIKKILVISSLLTAASFCTPVFSADTQTETPNVSQNALKSVQFHKKNNNTIEIKLITKKKMLSAPLIFERGKNVYLVSLPEMDYAGERKISTENFEKYLNDVTVDFVSYKTIKKGGYTRIIVKTENDVKIKVTSSNNFAISLSDLPISKHSLLKIFELLALLGGIIVIAGGALYIYIRNKNKKVLNNILDNTDNIIVEDVVENDNEKSDITEQDDAVLEFLNTNNEILQEVENIEVVQEENVDEVEQIETVDNQDDILAQEEIVEEIAQIETVDNQDDILAQEEIVEEIEQIETVDKQDDILAQEEIVEEIAQDEIFDENCEEDSIENEYGPSPDEIVNDILSNDAVVEAISETILDNIQQDIEEHLETDYNLEKLESDEENDIVNEIENENTISEENENQDTFDQPDVNDINIELREVESTSGMTTFVTNTVNLDFTNTVALNDETQSEILEEISQEDNIENDEILQELQDNIEEEILDTIENNVIESNEVENEIFENIEQTEFNQEEQQEFLTSEFDIGGLDGILGGIPLDDEINPSEDVASEEENVENDDIFAELMNTASSSESEIGEETLSEQVENVALEDVVQNEDIIDESTDADNLQTTIEEKSENANNESETNEIAEDNIEVQEHEILTPENEIAENDVVENIEHEPEEEIVEGKDINPEQEKIIEEIEIMQEAEQNTEATVEENALEQFTDKFFNNNEEEQVVGSIENTEDIIDKSYEIDSQQDEQIETTDFFKETEKPVTNEAETAPETFFKDEFDYTNEDDSADNNEDTDEQDNNDLSFFKEDNTVEEIDDSEPIVISQKELPDNKLLYLIRHEGQFSLIGIHNENVYVLNKFENEPKKTAICTKLNETNENNNIYIIKIDKWRALISVSENNMENLLTLS